MTVYQDLLLEGVRAYLAKSEVGIIANLHIAINYVVTGDMKEFEYEKLVHKSMIWIRELEVKNEQERNNKTARID